MDKQGEPIGHWLTHTWTLSLSHGCR